MGVVSPLGCDVDKFWERLVSGQSGIRTITHFDTTDFTSKIGGEVIELNLDAFVSKKDQRHLDPFSQYGVAAAKLAMTDSGLDLEREVHERIGVIVGSGIGGLLVMQKQTQVWLEKGPSRFSPFMIPEMIVNIVAGLIAIEYGLTGPNFGVVSA
jgi:3-oxoacyl-[acyl-carrier-protein] synthase II